MKAVSLKNIIFSYENSYEKVLNRFSLDIPAGCVTAILGPNGAGKTTLLSIILGLFKPEKGEIGIFDRPISSYSAQRRRQITALVAQNESVPFDLTVKEYVLLGRAPYLHILGLPGKKDMIIAERAMEKTGIKKMAKRSVPSLSSGEKQLASIARALAQRPRILLLDEPTSHLDLSNSKRILSLMRTIAEEPKRTVLFTTHDPNAAAATAGHVILMGKKDLVASGPPRKVFTKENLSAAYEDSITIIETPERPVIMAI